MNAKTFEDLAIAVPIRNSTFILTISTGSNTRRNVAECNGVTQHLTNGHTFTIARGATLGALRFTRRHLLGGPSHCSKERIAEQWLTQHIGRTSSKRS